jgi:hypothetical protein
VAQSATAFSVRETGFSFLIQSEWSEPQQARTETKWVDQAVEALAPFASDTVCGKSRRGRAGSSKALLRTQLRAPGRDQARVRP